MIERFVHGMADQLEECTGVRVHGRTGVRVYDRNVQAYVFTVSRFCVLCIPG